MAKRFIDSDTFKLPHVRSMEGAYKLLWIYINLACNHAGIWIVDFEIAQIYLGKDMPINRLDALKYFNKGETRIIEIEEEILWFIPSFISFQYGILSNKNKAHNSVIKILKSYNLYKDNMGHVCPLEADEDKDKVRDKDKDKGFVFDYVKFIELFNKLKGSKFKGCKKSKIQFNQRTKEGVTLDEFQHAITNCMLDPYHKENPGYLTPEFITRSDKLEKYLNYQIKPSRSNRQKESSFD